MKSWTVCHGGHAHWGENGAAGFVFRSWSDAGEPIYLLQQRSRWVDCGRTWGIPGGAMREGESPEEAARREAQEEIGPIPAYRVTGIEAQDCGGGWTFYLITADVDRPFRAYAVQETDATGWFTAREMDRLTLHPELRKWLDGHELQSA